MPLHVTVATEDMLSEAVALRLLAEHSPRLMLHQSLHQQGFGYLKRKLNAFRQMAQRQPVFLLTDLDRQQCALELITQWSNGRPYPTNLLFRVAVREVEAWLLADRENLSTFLSLPSGRLSSVP